MVIFFFHPFSLPTLFLNGPAKISYKSQLMELLLGAFFLFSDEGNLQSLFEDVQLYTG